MTDPVIRPAVPEDFPHIQRINDAAVPAVNPQTLADLEKALSSSALFDVAVVDSGIVGLLVVYAAGSDYESLNYRWFNRRYPRFLYVDRVVVASEARGLGVGAAFYDKVERVAKLRDIHQVTCEVNVRPPNEGSMRFHDRRGFEPVGTQQTEGGKKEVALLRKILTPAISLGL